MDPSSDRKVTIPLAVVVARDATDRPWQSHIWRPLSVRLAPHHEPGWRELQRGPGFVHYGAVTPPLDLHAKDIAGYNVNLSNGVPSLYVVLREGAKGDGAPVRVHLVTASPFDVQSYGARPDEIIGRVAMPEDLVALVTAFVADAGGHANLAIKPCEAVAHGIRGRETV